MTLNGIDVSDVRVYKIQATAILGGSLAELEFTSPTRQTLIQELPFVNPSGSEWIVKASYQGGGFNGPACITIPPRSSLSYPVGFAPTRIGEIKSVLTLFNMSTTQKHVYNLKGMGQDPIPESTVEIRCSAREKIAYSLVVKNLAVDDGESYEVVTDLPRTTGAGEFIIAPGQKEYVYEFTIAPIISGRFSKHIYFYNKSGSYQWHVVEVSSLRFNVFSLM